MKVTQPMTEVKLWLWLCLTKNCSHKMKKRISWISWTRWYDYNYVILRRNSTGASYWKHSENLKISVEENKQKSAKKYHKTDRRSNDATWGWKSRKDSKPGHCYQQIQTLQSYEEVRINILPYHNSGEVSIMRNDTKKNLWSYWGIKSMIWNYAFVNISSAAFQQPPKISK